MTEQRGRTLGIVLLLSLAVNLLLIGAIAAHWMHGGFDRHSRSMPVHGLPSMKQLAAGLSVEARDKLREAMRSNGSHLRQHLGEARDARHAVSEALRVEPFDAVALQQAFAEQRAGDARVAEDIQGMLTELAATLDAKDRSALLQAMAKGHGGNDRSGRRRGGGESSRSDKPEESSDHH